MQIQRRERNKLIRIKDFNGNWLEGQADVMNGIGNFYNNLYTPELSSDICSCIQVVPNCVNHDMNTSLNAIVSFVEIGNAVFSMGAHKAPGPDGLNGLFLSEIWETVKDDVVSVVQSFFTSKSLGEDINLTSVCLIPKNSAA